jgi:uncharacterized protein with GYD domain
MPKYLITASYTQEGVKGLLKDGGSKRRQAVENLATALGGSIDAFYYMFGSDDALVIADLPDEATAAAVSLTVAASGSATLNTTVLLEPETIDDATNKSINYIPPGN